jgi:hypothetical protein
MAWAVWRASVLGLRLRAFGRLLLGRCDAFEVLLQAWDVTNVDHQCSSCVK